VNRENVKQWPNLPEDYGDGHRQFDVADAAYRAVEPVAWFASGVSFYLVLTLTSWIFAIPCGILVYLFIVIPHKKRLGAARKAMVEDIVAYQNYIDSVE
jgi:hypothetical protein